MHFLKKKHVCKSGKASEFRSKKALKQTKREQKIKNLSFKNGLEMSKKGSKKPKKQGKREPKILDTKRIYIKWTKRPKQASKKKIQRKKRPKKR